MAHEVDGARTAMMDEALEQSCILTATAFVRVENVLSGLHVDAHRMLAISTSAAASSWPRP